MKRSGGKQIARWVVVGLTVLAVAVWFSWPHLRFWYLFESLGPNAQRYPEYRHRQTGIIFVRVPGGTFWMGAQKTDPKGPDYEPDAREDEGPVHEVTLSPFLIAKCEVKQSEWRRVMGNIPAQFPGGDLPVEQVFWMDCQIFCRKTGLRLPTEAEWEYACRARTTGPYAGTGRLDDMGWYRDNSRNTAIGLPPLNCTHVVGQKQPNQFGLYDMHGNVLEWCEDVYDAAFYSKPEARGPNPVSTSGSEYRVGRGGCWSVGASFCRSAFRGRNPPSLIRDYIGFRVAAPVP